jgi:hypothetical protein
VPESSPGTSLVAYSFFYDDFPLYHFRVNTTFIEMDENKIAKKTIPIHAYPSQKPAAENTARASEMIQPKMSVAI